MAAPLNRAAPSPATGIQLRDATERDLSRIYEIERACYSQPWTIGSFQRELTLPFSRLVIANARSSASPQTVGFLCRWLVADESHILNIAVHPQVRRNGVGSELLTSAIDEAKAKEVQVLTLEVRRSNLAARCLYRKFHFEERRLRRNYYAPGEDAIVMELQLI